MLLFTMLIFLILMLSGLYICFNAKYKYKKHINKTVYSYCRNQNITCKISEINWTDYFNPRMKLSVKLPSGTGYDLLTNMNIFKELWRE